MFDKPVILTCAVTGGLTRPDINPKLPITPRQIADACLDAATAGAAIVHIHVRDPTTGRQSMDLDYYKEVVELVRAKNSAVLINLTTGPGGRYEPGADDPLKPGPNTTLVKPERRVEHIVALKPDIATLDLNTMNSGDGIVINTPVSVRKMAAAIYENGVMPELEFFDSGDIAMAQDLVKDNSLKVPAMACFVLGVKYGFSPLTESMLLARAMVPAGIHWTGFGIGKWAFAMLAQSVILGGNARIGMEDTVHIAKGKLASGNAELVDQAVSIIKQLGAGIASPEQARSILGIAKR